MFIARLLEALRHRVMESGKTIPLEIFCFAKEMEQIEDEKRHKKLISMVKAVTKVNPNSEDYINEDSIGLEGLDDEELEFVNAIRFQKGRPPYRREQFFNKPAGNAGPKEQPIKCRYCKKMKHMQEECKSRLHDKAPEVDATGKPNASLTTSRPAHPTQTRGSTWSKR